MTLRFGVDGPQVLRVLNAKRVNHHLEYETPPRETLDALISLLEHDPEKLALRPSLPDADIDGPI